MEVECWGVAPADPGAAVMSGTLEMEFGDSMMVFATPTLVGLTLLPVPSPV